MLEKTFAIALIVTFFVLLSNRSGVREAFIRWLASHEGRLFGLMAEAVSCDFCLGFWLSLIVSTAYAYVSGCPYDVFMCVLSAPIVRFLT